MSVPTKDEPTPDAQIRQFAKDFDIPMESYKWNQKTQVITFHCIEATPSEINRWDWQVPAFVVGGHYEAIKSTLLRLREQAVKIDIPNDALMTMVSVDAVLLGHIDKELKQL